MEILVHNLQRNVRFEGKFVKSVVEKVLEMEDYPLGEVSVVLVDDKRIRDFNREYRGINRSTDVLSFSMREGSSPTVNPLILGDVIISVERAKKQAREYHHSLRKEIAYLVIHGLLHILGYDHRSKAQATRMRQREKEILKSLHL